VEQIMGLPISVLARGDEARSSRARAAVADLFAELRRVDADLSPYREDSQLSRFVRGELPLTDSGADLQEVARRVDVARASTAGLFDATRPDGRWDPSGLVKGWAVERAANHLVAVTDLDWCLNAGGDVVVLSASESPFTIGIEDPLSPGRIAATTTLAAGGVATSGTAARGEHLYDPRSNRAARAIASITVRGPSLETADVLATAAFVAGGEALELLTRFAGYEALVIQLDGRQRQTAAW
jgi:thiamine biosynthesis lipoprotein